MYVKVFHPPAFNAITVVPVVKLVVTLVVVEAHRLVELVVPDVVMLVPEVEVLLTETV